MAGYVFEHESCIHLPCGCLIARDESNHATEDTHWQTSVHVKRCAEHEAAGSSGADCHQHAMSVSAAQAEFMNQVSDQAYVPVFQQDAEPVAVLDGKGAVIGWQFTATQIADKRLKVPFQYLMSPTTGEFVVRHPEITSVMLDTIRKAVAANPKANLILADDATHASVWTEYDGVAQSGGQYLFWAKPAGAVTMVASNG